MGTVSPTRRTRVAGLGLALLLAAGFAADAMVLLAARAEAEAPSIAKRPETVADSTRYPRLNVASAPRATAQPVSRESSSGPARLVFWQGFSETTQPVRRTSWSLGVLALTLALAVCGAIATVVRRLLPSNAPAGATVISRMCLSPKHTIYLVQIGQRILVVGTGPQAAPALLSELDDLSLPAPNLTRGGEV
jgi:flagellar biogenesis protein FliO